MHRESPLRIFAFSTIGTALIVGAVLFNLGTAALVTTLTLLVIEVMFSFENAIINAKVLTTLSRFWQTMFLSVGIIIAIFGMRIVFPIMIVAIATGLPWSEVVDLALHNPTEYAAQISTAEPVILAFGGAFLLMLAFAFFTDESNKILWWRAPERLLKRLNTRWTPAIVTAGAIGAIALISDHTSQVLTAGAVGIVTYIVIHGLTEIFSKLQGKTTNSKKVIQKTGMAAFITFMYLEVLDASFSLDGVIGAFAITEQVILIAAGLGAGALWVRSMTVYMVRRGTLGRYRYLEHGAHYTVLVLALVMLASLLVHLPEALAGLAGLVLIGSSILASKKS